MSSALIFGFESHRPYPFYLTIDPVEGVSDGELYPFVAENLKGLQVVSSSKPRSSSCWTSTVMCSNLKTLGS